MEKQRKAKYPIFYAQNERDGRTDINFYCVVGLHLYYHIYMPISGDYSISKNTISSTNHNTKKEFEDRCYYKITEVAYREAEKKAMSRLITSITLRQEEESKQSVDVLKKTLASLQKNSFEVEQLIEKLATKS